jgi:hypothetical protein
VKIITIIPVKVLTNTEYNSCRFESCPATNSILIKQLTTMLEIKNQKTKTTACRENGRSADFTSGNFILGCSTKKGDTYDNPCSYCYVARFGRQNVNTNTDELLAECEKPYKTCLP